MTFVEGHYMNQIRILYIPIETQSLDKVTGNCWESSSLHPGFHCSIKVGFHM